MLQISLKEKQVKTSGYWFRVLLLGVHMQQMILMNVSIVYLLVHECVFRTSSACFSYKDIVRQ